MNVKPVQSRRRRETTSSVAPFWMLSLICWTWVIHEAALPVTAAGVAAVQTNFGDASFAGGMAYDLTLDVVYVTGQVGPSSCFVGVLKHTAAASSSSASCRSGDTRKRRLRRVKTSRSAEAAPTVFDCKNFITCEFLSLLKKD